MKATLQSSLLSPFSLKARLLCKAYGVETTMTPEDGGLVMAAKVQMMMELAARGLGESLHRAPSKLEEFPLVPWLFPEGGGYLCDSTEIGLFLERTQSVEGRLTPRDPLSAFAARLVEEAIDEVGLYALHHMRWVVSGRSTRAMEFLGNEIAGSLGTIAARAFIARFGPRQVGRLPYLFSVAPEGDSFGDMAPNMRPPTRDGFPPTHALLEEIWETLLDALESVLADGRKYLFGDGLTLADAALMGNLGSTLLLDPEAAQRLEARAPRTASWVREGLEGRLVFSDEHSLDKAHGPLLAWVSESFMPLMKQNAHHYKLTRTQIARNERAFNRHKNLFEGELRGYPYRSVVKDFQFKVFEELNGLFEGLSVDQKHRLTSVSETDIGVFLQP